MTVLKILNYIIILSTYPSVCTSELSISVLPKTSVAVAGEDFNFTCTVLNGVESFDFEWLRGDGRGKKIKPGDNDRIRIITESLHTSTLIFSPVELEDSGKYSCKAENNEHYLLSPGSSLNVLVCESSNSKFYPKENITLGCSVSSEITPLTLSWIDSIYPNSTSNTATSTRLTFIAFESLNRHVMRCVARTDDNAVGECKFTLRIISRLNVSVTSVLTEDGNHQLECATDAEDSSDLVYRWSSNSSLAFNGELGMVGGTNVSLRNDVTPFNPILIICVVHGNDYEGESSIMLYKPEYIFTTKPDNRPSTNISTIENQTTLKYTHSISTVYIGYEDKKSASIFDSDNFRIILICLLGAIFIAIFCLMLKISKTRKDWKSNVFNFDRPPPDESKTYISMTRNSLLPGTPEPFYPPGGPRCSDTWSAKSMASDPPRTRCGDTWSAKSMAPDLPRTRCADTWSAKSMAPDLPPPRCGDTWSAKATTPDLYRLQNGDNTWYEKPVVPDLHRSHSSDTGSTKYVTPDLHRLRRHATWSTKPKAPEAHQSSILPVVTGSSLKSRTPVIPSEESPYVEEYIYHSIENETYENNYELTIM